MDYVPADSYTIYTFIPKKNVTKFTEWKKQCSETKDFLCAVGCIMYTDSMAKQIMMMDKSLHSFSIFENRATNHFSRWN